MRKYFDKELYDECDSPAKNAVKNIFKNLTGHVFSIEENEKKRGVDLLAYTNGDHVFNIETEVKKVWTDEFSYDSVQFPERKQKFAELDKPTIFIMFNKDLTQYLVVNNSDLLNSPKTMVRNKYIRYGEYFFQVPLNKVVFNDIKTALINMRGTK